MSRLANFRTRKLHGGLSAEKIRKVDANYRDDNAGDNRFCARCRMYRDENKCTLVSGFVHRVGLCDFYEPIAKSAA
jgi:hypothetical protein